MTSTMFRNSRNVLLVLLAFTLFSCSSISSGKIHHIVLVWLDDDVTMQQREELIQQTKLLLNIPYVEQLYVGPSIASDRPIVDDSFSFGITMIFANESDMNAYIKHPLHTEYVKTKLKPVLKAVKVYDY